MILPDDVVERSSRGFYEAAIALAKRHAIGDWAQAPPFDSTPLDQRNELAGCIRAALEAARYGEMREALKQCADSLEAELHARYPVEAEGHAPYPTMKRRYDRDMAEVVKARALLSTIGEPNNGGRRE